VLGEAVNLAARLESNAPVGGILVSARTHELMNGAVPARRLDPIRVKGVDHPVEVYVLELAEPEPGSREAVTAPARGADE
jgi:class 3 adenylate cyclase